MATALTKPEISAPERYPGGDRKPANDNDAPRGRAPTLVKRIMDHAVAMGSDPRAATVLGRLHLTGVLTETETEAGFLYAEDFGRWARAKGCPRRHAKSPSFEAGYGDSRLDLGALERMDPERAKKIEEQIKRRIKKAEKHYDKARSVLPASPQMIQGVLDEVCLSDQSIHYSMLPSLKMLLGLLASKCYRLSAGGGTEAKPEKQRKAKVSDAVHLAEAACDAITAWFEKERAELQAFAIGNGKHKQRRITAYGVWTKDNRTPVSHSIDVRLRGLPPYILDAQLVKAGIAKGWADASKIRRKP